MAKKWSLAIKWATTWQNWKKGLWNQCLRCWIKLQWAFIHSSKFDLISEVYQDQNNITNTKVKKNCNTFLIFCYGYTMFESVSKISNKASWAFVGNTQPAFDWRHMPSWTRLQDILSSVIQVQISASTFMQSHHTCRLCCLHETTNALPLLYSYSLK